VATALIIGFVGGVVYSAYQPPAPTAGGSHPQQQQSGHQHSPAETIAALEQATRDNPKDGQRWVELGHAYFDTGQSKQAIAAYNQALELLPGDLNVMTDLGVMYHQDNQHHRAIELFDQVLQTKPEHEQARFNKGVVLLTGLDDPKATLAEWKILITHNPMATAPSGKLVADLIGQLEKQVQERAKP